MSNAAFSLPRPEPGETGPYALVGQARARPGKAAALERELLALVEPTRREAGALQYHVHRDRADPDRFVFYEAWRSIADLEAHLAKPYIGAFLGKRVDYLAEEMSVTWLRMASPCPAA